MILSNFWSLILILLIHGNVLAVWGVQGKMLYRKTPEAALNGYQQFQMFPMDQSQDTAKLLSKVCEKEQRKYQVKAGGSRGAAWWSRSPHYSSWRTHPAADGYSWKKLSPWGPPWHGDPHDKGRTKVWGWSRSSYKPLCSGCNFPCHPALLRDGIGIWN